MANAVFIAKKASIYDDTPEERYHFPKIYLKRVLETVGDWIIYYESQRNGGRKVYFAAAKVVRVEPDSNKEDHYYAYVSGYVQFTQPVPYRINGKTLESLVSNPDDTVNRGHNINPVRPLPRKEFEIILRLGMTEAINDAVTEENMQPEQAVAETQTEYGGARKSMNVSRVVRDMAFKRVVRNAYDKTCAMTGLKLVNGGGRCEIEAAHIKAVEHDGPDSPRNGLALSRTVHWMFDRGILSVADDGMILMAGKLVPDQVKRMLNPGGRIILPKESRFAPHPTFLRFHRENRYKGD